MQLIPACSSSGACRSTPPSNPSEPSGSPSATRSGGFPTGSSASARTGSRCCRRSSTRSIRTWRRRSRLPPRRWRSPPSRTCLRRPTSTASGISGSSPADGCGLTICCTAASRSTRTTCSGVYGTKGSSLPVRGSRCACRRPTRRSTLTSRIPISGRRCTPRTWMACGARSRRSSRPLPRPIWSSSGISPTSSSTSAWVRQTS